MTQDVGNRLTQHQCQHPLLCYRHSHRFAVTLDNDAGGLERCLGAIEFGEQIASAIT